MRDSPSRFDGVIRRTRCKCHPRPEYAGCYACPNCSHWSMTHGVCLRDQCRYDENHVEGKPWLN